MGANHLADVIMRQVPNLHVTAKNIVSKQGSVSILQVKKEFD